MIKEAWFYIRVIIMVVVLLFPFIIMLSVSLKSTAETIGYPPTIIPHEWTLQHFADIFNENIFPFLRYFKNSLYITLVTSVVAVLMGILGGYALSRLKFKGKAGISELFFLVYMFSGILLIVPLFKMLSAIGLSNSREAVIICMIVQTMPTAIYMTRSYFDTIPVELEEAGKSRRSQQNGNYFPNRSSAFTFRNYFRIRIRVYDSMERRFVRIHLHRFPGSDDDSDRIELAVQYAGLHLGQNDGGITCYFTSCCDHVRIQSASDPQRKH